MGAQNIKVRRVTHDNSLLEDSTINFAIVINYLYRLDDSEQKYPWLSTIDIYGYTMLNRVQVPIFIDELEKLSLETDDSEVLNSINQTIDFMKKSNVHELIKFIGD